MNGKKGKHKKKKIRMFELYDPIFRCEFRLYIGNIEEFKAAVRDIDGYPGDDEFIPSKGDCVCFSAGAIAIRIEDLELSNPEHIATLAHECLHAVQIRLNTCSINKKEKEAPAYYLEFLISGFLKQLKGKGK